MGGTPAKPLRTWAREIALVRRLAEQDKSEDGDDGASL